MNESSAHTFYSATAKRTPSRLSLTQDIEADVCVIGGGFAGLWAARALAARGQDVVLLEAREIASGASGQNGGFVSAGFAAKLSNVADRVGLDHARELYALSREGVEIVRTAISADRTAVQAQPGRLHVIRYNDEPGLSDYREWLAKNFGHELEFWNKEKVRGTLASDRYYQALHESDAFHLNPLLLARRLANEAEDSGVRIFEHSRVVEADLDGLRKSVATGEGRVRAFHVVIAGSAALGKAFPWLTETILPVRTHVAVTAPIGDRLHQAIRYSGAIADTRRAGDYYHTIGDRLLWGGRISARRDPPRKLERLMTSDIARVYPQLEGVSLEYVWSGVMGYAVHMMPQVGMAQPGVWVSSAFGGQGLNTTAIAGELIASAIVEQNDRWKLFVPFGLVWAGGAAGRAVAQSAYWGMQLKDWADEAQTRAAERDEAAASAGLAPGYAAHLYRQQKRRFVESRFGKAALRTIDAIKRGAILAARPVIFAARKIRAAAAAVGSALVPVIRAIAKVIGAIARVAGAVMEAVAAAIVGAARLVAKGAIYFWTMMLVPGAKWFVARVAVPASQRFADSARLGAAWSAKQSTDVWNRRIVPAAEGAAKKARETGRRVIAARKKGDEPAAEESEADSGVKKKKKKPKDKDRDEDSGEKVEA